METTKITHTQKEMRGPAYYHQPGDKPFLYTTVAELIDKAAERWPDKEAIYSVQERVSYTFQQVRDKAEKFGAGFLELGLKPGDRLVLLGVNSVHWCITMLAASRAGIIVVMLNPAYRVQELGFALKKVKAKCLVTDHKFKTQDFPSILAELAPGMSSAPSGRPLACPQLPHLSFVIVHTDQRLPGCYRLADIEHLTTDKMTIRNAQDSVKPDDRVFIQFSSGTTGMPKATVMSHFSLINNVILNGIRFFDLEENGGICSFIPFFHVLGTSSVIISAFFGITLVVPGPIFHKKYAIEALETQKCNKMLGTPTMYFDICNELKSLLPKSPKLQKVCSEFKRICSGGDAIPSQLIKNLTECFPHCDIVLGYGLTETSGPIFSSHRNEPIERKLTSVGYVTDYAEVKIVDHTGEMVPFGTPGEAWFRSPYNFIEYWDNEEMTKDTTTPTGWLKSGDVMVLSEDGYGTVIGRKKDIIIRGGENILPSEIEQLLLRHPDIIDAQVYGVEDDRLGEDVAVTIILKKSCTISENSVKEYCRGKISHFKIPKYIKFVDMFPKTPSGKVIKYKLKQNHENELKGKNYKAV